MLALAAPIRRCRVHRPERPLRFRQVRWGRALAPLGVHLPGPARLVRHLRHPAGTALPVLAVAPAAVADTASKTQAEVAKGPDGFKPSGPFAVYRRFWKVRRPDVAAGIGDWHELQLIQLLRREGGADSRCRRKLGADRARNCAGRDPKR